mmetsp:Transcript_16898/g.40734  ORF Transcript_16898/g.40734 Transcript_16898/m.40734 type:complete len:224 (-) Transcript_16898:413-1084(-)
MTASARRCAAGRGSSSLVARHANRCATPFLSALLMLRRSRPSHVPVSSTGVGHTWGQSDAMRRPMKCRSSCPSSPPCSAILASATDHAKPWKPPWNENILAWLTTTNDTIWNAIFARRRILSLAAASGLAFCCIRKLMASTDTLRLLGMCATSHLMTPTRCFIFFSRSGFVDITEVPKSLRIRSTAACSCSARCSQSVSSTSTTAFSYAEASGSGASTSRCRS